MSSRSRRVTLPLVASWLLVTAVLGGFAATAQAQTPAGPHRPTPSHAAHHGQISMHHQVHPHVVPDQWALVAVTGTFSCAIDTTRQLWCWGGNKKGQLGFGNTEPVSVPFPVG